MTCPGDVSFSLAVVLSNMSSDWLYILSSAGSGFGNQTCVWRIGLLRLLELVELSAILAPSASCIHLQNISKKCWLFQKSQRRKCTPLHN
jgi:hypothetical protein